MSTFKNYEMQICDLRSKGVIITDETLATRILQVYSFENLVRFCNVIKGEKIDLISAVQLYLFECSFKSLIMKYIRIIEDELKENIGYMISEQFGSTTDVNSDKLSLENDYLNINNYKKNSNTKKILKNNKRNILKPKKYHKNIRAAKISGNVAPDALVKDMYLNEAVKFYKILKPNIKERINNVFLKNDTISYEIKINFVTTSLASLVNLRNNCAHSSTICNFSSEYDIDTTIFHSYKIFGKDKIITNKEIKETYKRNSLFISLISLYLLLDDISKPLFICDLTVIFGEFNGLKYIKPDNLSYFGLPNDFLERFAYFTIDNQNYSGIDISIY